jgi:cytochrome c oxidase cbb3-type subunit 3
MASRTERLLDHEYDGIREYDNPTPGWWHAIFLGSILFSVCYFAWYHFSVFAKGVNQRYHAVVTAQLQKQFREIGQLTPDEPTILRFMAEPRWLQVAEGAFRTNCVSCHGAEGQGQEGPNMTDDHYKNIKKLEDLPVVIAGGAANGAMPAWKGRLTENEIVLLASYVASLRGKNLPSTRPAEGDVIPPWPKAPAGETGEPAKPGARPDRSAS